MRGSRRLPQNWKKSMHNRNTFGSDERQEVGGKDAAAQQFEQILASGLPTLYRRAYRILGNTADAEDAVQDAVLAAYTHLNQFRGQAQISTWMSAIVLNCARMQLRRRPRLVHLSLDQPDGELQPFSVSERLADHRPSPEDESVTFELSARLSHSYRQLSPTLRRTFQLRDIDGLSIRETARILGVPTGTVKAQSARARRRLKELMRHTPRPRARRLRNRFADFSNSIADTALQSNYMAPRVKSESDRASVGVGAREILVTHAASFHAGDKLT
jgi:RNA polymerase sigma-70 factor, ECF subfamily